MKRKDWTLEELKHLPKTREEAIIYGSNYYYTGNKCSRGHIAAIETKRNRCVECRREVGKLAAEKRNRRLGVKKQKTLIPLLPGIRSNKLTSTGGFKRNSFKGKNQYYTRVHHEVRCDCGVIFWIRNKDWGKTIQCLKCDRIEKIKYAKEVRQNIAYIKGGASKTIEASLLYAARRRAINSGIDFEISLEDIIIPEYCPVLGIKIDATTRGSNKNRVPRFNAPSLDRTNPNLGYTKENTKVISYRANVLKKDGTASEHLKVAEFMERMGVS